MIKLVLVSCILLAEVDGKFIGQCYKTRKEAVEAYLSYAELLSSRLSNQSCIIN